MTKSRSENFMHLKRRKQKSTKNFTKRYLKFLSICNNPSTSVAVLKTAPDRVIKRICDAALNVADGDIPLSKKQKDLFTNNRATFHKLVTKSIPVSKKRKLLVNQRGGALAILPLILSPVLDTLGSLLFQKGREQ